MLVYNIIAHSLIRGVLIQSCSAGAKNFINYVFCHPQFSGVIQYIENHCANRPNFEKNWFLLYKISYFDNNQHRQIGVNGTMIFNILDNTTELWMTKYLIGEIFSSGGATLYKNPSDQTEKCK